MAEQVYQYCKLYPELRYRRTIYWVSIFAALAVFCATFYSYCLVFWWSHDDLHHLLFVNRTPVMDVIFKPETYRKFHDVHLAPWNIVSYYIDVALFGHDAKSFYLHRIVSASFLACVGFFYLRFWLSTAWSALAVVLFLISPPCIIAVSQLMNGHYLEGLIFAIAGASGFVIAIRKQSIAAALCGAAFYFMATAAKEIFVPLPLILLVTPLPPFRKRVLFLQPYLLVLVFYYFWRAHFISDSFGTWIYDLTLSGVMALPARLVQFSFGIGGLSKAAAILCMFTMVYYLITVRSTRLLAVGISIALTIPLLPVSETGGPERFHILSAFTVIAIFILSVCALHERQKNWRPFILTGILFLVSVQVYNSFATLDRVKRENNAFEEVGKFVVYEDQDKSLLTLQRKFGAEYARKFRRMLGRGEGPSVYYDLYQYQEPYPHKNLYQYQHGSGHISEISDQFAAIQKRHQRKMQIRPLEAHLTKSVAGVRWKFGPYTDNRYSIVLTSSNEAFTHVYYQGIYRGRLPAMKFRVRYNSPQGWITYSDELSWSGSTGEQLSWERE